MGGDARRFWAGVFLLGLTSCGGGPGGTPAPLAPTAELDSEARAWVERTLSGLTDAELVGQLVIQWIPGGYVSPSSPDFDQLERWVVDDGIGMSDAILGHIYERGVGLRNLRDRLEQLYGPTHSPAIVSRPGEGTRVELRLPAHLPHAA